MGQIVLEALFHREPTLPVEVLCQGLARFFGPIEAGWKDDVLVLAFVDRPIRMGGKDLPMTLLLRVEELERCSIDYEPALEQSWDWPEAEEAIQGCGWAVVLTEPFGTRLPAPFRTAFLGAALRVLCQVMEPAAIHGCEAGILVDPEQVIGSPDPLMGLVAIRRYRLDDGDDGELLDTLGMASLGLVDLQTRAAEGTSEASIQHLRRLLRVQLEGGAVKGARGSASVEPRRSVLRV